MNNIFTNSRVLVQIKLWLSMQLEYVVGQLVRTFNRFYAVNSTAEFLFELADNFSLVTTGLIFSSGLLFAYVTVAIVRNIKKFVSHTVTI